MIIVTTQSSSCYASPVVPGKEDDPSPSVTSLLSPSSSVPVSQDKSLSTFQFDPYSSHNQVLMRNFFLPNHFPSSKSRDLVNNDMMSDDKDFPSPVSHSLSVDQNDNQELSVGDNEDSGDIYGRKSYKTLFAIQDLDPSISSEAKSWTGRDETARTMIVGGEEDAEGREAESIPSKRIPQQNEILNLIRRKYQEYQRQQRYQEKMTQNLDSQIKEPSSKRALSLFTHWRGSPPAVNRMSAIHSRGMKSPGGSLRWG